MLVTVQVALKSLLKAAVLEDLVDELLWHACDTLRKVEKLGLLLALAALDHDPATLGDAAIKATQLLDDGLDRVLTRLARDQEEARDLLTLRTHMLCVGVGGVLDAREEVLQVRRELGLLTPCVLVVRRVGGQVVEAEDARATSRSKKVI